MDHEKRPRDFALQIGPYLPETASERVHQWLSNWPGKLDREDVLANRLSLVLRQPPEPTPYRLIACISLKKYHRQWTLIIQYKATVP